MAKTSRIEVNNIFYDYAIGDMWVLVAIAPAKDQWAAAIPAYAQLQLTIPTPPELRGADCRNGEIKRQIDKLIRAKIAERRQGGGQ